MNRESSALKRAFNLGIENDKIFRKPKIKMLAENNAREGFFEWSDFISVRNHLPEYLKAPATFACFTGWRVRSEVLRMQWSQIDLQTGTARLEPNTAKNKKARLIYIPYELKKTLIPLKKDLGLIFHNDGSPIVNYYKAWHKAVKDAKLTKKFLHDFRRTAVRHLVRAGISEHTAMMMTGHRTRSVFDRYDIVNEADLKDAANKLTTFSTTLSSNQPESRRSIGKYRVSHPSSVGRATDS